IEESFVSRLKHGDVFVFAGKTLALFRIQGMTAYVRKAKGAGIVPHWWGTRLPLSTELADAVRAKLAAASDGAVDPVLDPELHAVLPLLALQADWSYLPTPETLLVEEVKTRDGWHLFVFPFEGRGVHEGLATLAAHRITQRRKRSLTITVNDYGFELLSPDPWEIDPDLWRDLFALEGLADDLAACLNMGEMAKRQFRDVARIAGLVTPGFPGKSKTSRQAQASSELFFDVFRDFDPGSLLLDQARREVLEQQLDYHRLRAALERMSRQKVRYVRPARLTPLAFPLWAGRLQGQISNEDLHDRIDRMVVQLEAAADRKATSADEERAVSSKTPKDRQSARNSRNRLDR
ncbi:MAG: DNA ligase-associated DEXH box helicase, partial [Planctomycetia bacterium]